MPLAYVDSDGVIRKVCSACAKDAESGGWEVEAYVADKHFYRSNKTADGYQTQCKTCQKEAQDRWRRDNREKLTEAARVRRERIEAYQAQLAEARKAQPTNVPDKITVSPSEYEHIKGITIRDVT